MGERWALLVVRELMLGPKRFSDLRDGLPKIGPDMLSQRLRELEPVLLALGRWGSEVAFPADASAFSPDSMVLALKTLFSAPAAAAADGVLGRTYELRLDEQRFRLRPTAALLEADRGEVPQPVALIAAAPATLARLLWHGASLEDELRRGGIRIEGDRASAESLLELFPAPAS